jgi:hypothetical protein
MSGYLLHDNATVLCAHAGQARPTLLNTRVKVAGKPIVTQPNPYTVSGCSLAGSGTAPCATAQWVTAAQRIRASGQPILLMDSQATCTPTGTPLNILVTQTRVKGV